MHVYSGAHQSETNRNTAHEPDDFNQEWSVQTSAVDIEITSKVFQRSLLCGPHIMYMQVTTAYPGEQFLLGIQALDEIGRPTSDIIRITDLTDRVNACQYVFIFIVIIIMGGTMCKHTD